MASQGVRRAAAGGAVIAVAIAAMNVSTYLSTLLAARLLGPREYGGFAAFSGLLLVLGVLMLGLQTTGARRIAASPGQVAEIERTLLGVTYRAAWVLAAVCLVLTPVFDAGLHLSSVATALVVALVAWPMTAVGGQSGVLQGERRWVPLAALYLAMGVARLLTTMLLLWRPQESVAALSMLVGYVAPALVGWWALRRGERPPAPASGDHGGREVLRELGANSHALLAFFALSNADVILSRFVLDAHQSGLYAGGLIVVKSLLFLPQFVIVVAFPAMATESARRTTLVRSTGLVLGLGALGILGSWLLSGLALVFVGGSEYAAIRDQLWVFAVLGTVLSTVQLLVYSVVARQSRRSVYLVWAALAVLAIAVTRAGTVTEMVVTVCLVDGALMLALLAVSWWRLRDDVPGAEDRSVGGGVPAHAGADRDVEGDGEVGR